MAATVSVSPPIPIAVTSVSARCRPGYAAGIGVWWIADHADCRAVTTQPLRRNRSGGPCSASSMQASQYSRSGPSRCASPPRRSRTCSRTARSMADDHRTHAWAVRGSEWVRSLTAVAARTIAPVSPRWARATGAVRMREPLPAEW